MNRRLARPLHGVQPLAEERIVEDLHRHLIEDDPDHFLRYYTNQTRWDGPVLDCLDYLKAFKYSSEPTDTPSNTLLPQNNAVTSSLGTSNLFSPPSQSLPHDYPAGSNSSQSMHDTSIHLFPQNDAAPSSSSTDNAVEAGEKQTDNREQFFLSENCVWTIFPEEKPTNEESSFFERIMVISELVVHRMESEHGLERTASLLLRPDHKTTSETEEASFQSDGIWVLAKSLKNRGKIDSINSSWVSANGEWKLENTAEKLVDNRKQVVGAAAHYMNNNPCRSHMFSITIEDYDVRLWFYSRSHCVKTTAFDLRTQPEYLIRFLLAMGFGTREELGFAPNIEQKVFEEKSCYIFTIKEKRYMTIDQIRESPPPSFCGRCTRVWSCWELDEHGKPIRDVEHVIKDFCDEEEVDADTAHMAMDIDEATGANDTQPLRSAKEEVIWKNIASNLGALRRALQTLGNEEKQKEQVTALKDQQKQSKNSVSDVQLQECEGIIQDFVQSLPDDLSRLDFVLKSIAEYESFFVAVACSQSTSERFPLQDLGPRQTCSPFEKLGDSHYRIETAKERSSSRVNNSHNFPWVLPDLTEKARVFRRIVRCQVVYYQKCTPIRDLKNFELIKPVITDAVTALLLLHFIGYIHGDISPGNVYWDEQAGHGRISDFEFARLYNQLSSGTGTIKTGTQGFMSVEVETGDQLFIVDGSERVPHHSILHDLESAFWLTVWLFISRSRTLFIGQQAIDHLAAYTPYSFDKDKRIRFLRTDRVDRGDEQEVPKSPSQLKVELKANPSELRGLLETCGNEDAEVMLEGVRIVLRDAYLQTAGRKVTQKQVHDVIRACFNDIYDHLEDLKVEGGEMHRFLPEKSEAKTRSQEVDAAEINSEEEFDIGLGALDGIMKHLGLPVKATKNEPILKAPPAHRKNPAAYMASSSELSASGPSTRSAISNANNARQRSEGVGRTWKSLLPKNSTMTIPPPSSLRKRKLLESGNTKLEGAGCKKMRGISRSDVATHPHGTSNSSDDTIDSYWHETGGF